MGFLCWLLRAGVYLHLRRMLYDRLAGVILRLVGAVREKREKGGGIMPALENEHHEKFAQRLVACDSNRDAYIAAYPHAKNQGIKVLDANASRLAKKEKVQERCRELKEEAVHAAGGAVMSRNEKRAMLALMARDENASLADRQRAIDLDNKMEDEYTNNVSLKGSVNNPFAGMSTEELRKMVGNG